MRLIPPIAVPVGPSDVARSLVVRGGGVEAFARRIAAACDFERADLFASGREALAAYLSAARGTGRTEVVLPAYTCWSVPAAVVRAGFTVRVVDIDPISLAMPAFGVEAALGEKTLALVVAHLFARSDAAERSAASVARIAPDVRVVEDAAQALPLARAAGVHAAILSFGRGKPLALGGGGAVLHDGAPIGKAGRSSAGWSTAVKLVATSLLARPAWYRIPDSLPFLGIGETVYDPDFDTKGSFFDWQASLGSQQIERLHDHVRRRTAHAARLAAEIGDVPGWTLAAAARGDGPIRFPLLAPDRGERERVLHALRARGVAASAMYPGTLLDVQALRRHVVNADEPIPGARAVAERLLTLPVYPTLTSSEVAAIAAAFRSAAGRAAA